MRLRRTKLMIDHENNMIRDYIKSGATLYQIRESLKLSERNFRKRISKIRAQDLDKILDEQSAEARAGNTGEFKTNHREITFASKPDIKLQYRND